MNNPNYNYYLFLFIVIVSCISCNKIQKHKRLTELKSIGEPNIGKKLILPNSLQVYNPFLGSISDSIAISNANYKIYTYINASCGTCVLKISLWEGLIPEFKKHNVPIILICGSDDRFELLKYLCESEGVKIFSYPFFLDKENEFTNKNKFITEAKDFNTVLTDKDNAIILFGNPIHSNKIKDMYLKEIQKK